MEDIIDNYRTAIEGFSIFPKSDSLKEWAKRFVVWVDDCFCSFHSTNGEDDILKTAGEDLKGVITAFVKVMDDPPLYWHHAFISSVKYVFFRAFVLHPFCSDHLSNNRSTILLMNHLMECIDKHFEDYIESVPEGFFSKVSKVLFYNCWGADFLEGVRGVGPSLPLLSSEKEMVEAKANRDLLYRRLVSILKSAVDMKDYSSFCQACSDIEDLIKQLFKDYVRRLREKGVFDESVLEDAVTYWEIVTESILYRVYTTTTAEYVIAFKKDFQISRSLLEDIQDMMPHERRHVAAERALTTLMDITKEFRYSIISHGIHPVWTDRLVKLGVDYINLYDSMKDEYFSGITLDTFRQSFEFADFSQMYNSACRKKKKGVIQFMVSELGDSIGKDWLVQAAETVSNAKGSEAVREIRKGVINDPKREMRSLLRQWVANYRPRVIRAVSR